MFGPRRRIALAATALLAACGGAEPGDATEASADAPLPAGEVERLAATADPRTLYVVGNAYAIGDGVTKDQDIAERLWRAACDRGHAYACANYGSRQIAYGNFDAAESYLKIAAEAGVVDAIRNLIELYDNNSWSGADVDESVRWYAALEALEDPQPEQSPVEPDDPD